MTARLSINSQDYGGWLSIAIHRSIEQIAGAFELAVSDRWPGQDAASPILPGDSCTVEIDGEPVITGFVDDVHIRYTGASHEISVAGRDQTGDLVDCAAIHEAGHWRGVTLQQIANDLCAPFGIAVKAEADTGAPFADFALQEGESVFEALERLAKMRAVLLVSDGRGGLLITRAGTGTASGQLVLGENILAANGQFSHKDRFSQYIIKGQRKATDDDAESPEEAAAVKAELPDNGVKRYRPLIVIAEDMGDGQDFAQRAAWERSVRFGKSIRSTITVQGWRDAGGRLWQPNQKVAVKDHWQGIDAELLIAGVSFRLDEQGTVTDLELTHPAAFNLIAMEEHDKLGGKKKRAKVRTDPEEKGKPDTLDPDVIEWVIH